MGGFSFGKSSESKSKSSFVVDESAHQEDRKVAQSGAGNLSVGERSNVTYKVNGFTGKEVGDLLAGVTHDSPFGQPAPSVAVPPTGAAAVAAAAGGSIAKPALYVGAAVLGLIGLLFLAKRK